MNRRISHQWGGRLALAMCLLFARVAAHAADTQGTVFPSGWKVGKTWRIAVFHYRVGELYEGGDIGSGLYTPALSRCRGRRLDSFPQPPVKMAYILRVTLADEKQIEDIPCWVLRVRRENTFSGVRKHVRPPAEGVYYRTKNTGICLREFLDPADGDSFVANLLGFPKAGEEDYLPMLKMEAVESVLRDAGYSTPMAGVPMGLVARIGARIWGEETAKKYGFGWGAVEAEKNGMTGVDRRPLPKVSREEVFRRYRQSFYDPAWIFNHFPLRILSAEFRLLRNPITRRILAAKLAKGASAVRRIEKKEVGDYTWYWSVPWKLVTIMKNGKITAVKGIPLHPGMKEWRKRITFPVEFQVWRKGASWYTDAYVYQDDWFLAAEAHLLSPGEEAPQQYSSKR